MATSKANKTPRKAKATRKKPAAAKVVPAAKAKATAKTKATAAKAPSTPQAELALGVSVTKGRQTQARAAAKQNLQRTSGVVRVQANAAARTKRRQAKRDSR